MRQFQDLALSRAGQTDRWTKEQNQIQWTFPLPQLSNIID